MHGDAFDGSLPRRRRTAGSSRRTARSPRSASTSLGNMLFGLGMGPTLVALATDRLYRDHAALDIAIITVVAPAFGMATALLFVHLRADRRKVMELPVRAARIVSDPRG